MRYWLILMTSGLAVLPSIGEEPAQPASVPMPVLTTLPAAAPSPAPQPDPILHSAGKIRDDGSIQDSLGFVSVRPLPDAPSDVPPFFQRVSYLLKHNDTIMAISYLRQVVTNGDILPQYRARAILQLADCLGAQHQEAEALCWLKIWMELYPARPEIGAVAYRIGAIYTQMGLPDQARDAFYLALAHTINEGQVQTSDDLRRYTELTVGTLWGLAANEYQSGQWSRAAQLFARYRKECPTAPPLSMEKAAYLQADCYYQLKQTDKATTLYEQTLAQHPFNPLAPEARLRLYHLYLIKKSPEQAREELESLAWTVRTVWPKDETYWQRQTAEFLLDLNKKNVDVLPPLVQESAQLPPEGKSWQEALDHYDSLVSYQTAVRANVNMDSFVDSSGHAGNRRGLPEQADLLQMDRSLNQLLPGPRTASNP
jgi:outer membrane protein assembly factor BamD (BamD/ComL family)